MHRMHSSPASRMDRTFWFTRPSGSPTMCRRSECPARTILTSQSRSIAVETSPVTAPSGPGQQSWAPRRIALGLSRRMDPTVMRYGKGGKMAMSAPDSRARASITSRASREAEVRSVFIFQFPPTVGLRSRTVLSGALIRAGARRDRRV